jgi:hypothetical protein
MDKVQVLLGVQKRDLTLFATLPKVTQNQQEPPIKNTG